MSVVEQHGGFVIPAEYLPPGGIKSLPRVLRGSTYIIHETEADARDWRLRQAAIAATLQGKRRPLVEGMSFADTLRLRELL